MRSSFLFRNVAYAGVLTIASCTLRTTPSPETLPGDTPLAAGASATAVISGQPAVVAADGGKPQLTHNDAGVATTVPPMAAAAPPLKPMSSAAVTAANPDPDSDDAGLPKTTQQHADAGAVSPVMQQQCEPALSSCIIADPLGYDVCLRKNAERGCPEPQTGGAMTTTPVLDENGNPISQVCQAELAKCIMRLPTPENAQECTESARKCK